MIEFRRAKVGDYASVVELQSANLASNLSEDQKSDGFLSVGFTEEQFAGMDSDLAVVLGLDGNTVKAFLCTSTVEFNRPFALPRAMIDRFAHVIFDDKPLSEWRVAITGPVCIDASLRGQGVLEKLYVCFYDVAPPQYELAVVFVSLQNPRSIKAHEKLGMAIVDEFEFNSRKYVIMAFKRPS